MFHLRESLPLFGLFTYKCKERVYHWKEWLRNSWSTNAFLYSKYSFQVGLFSYIPKGYIYLNINRYKGVVPNREKIETWNYEIYFWNFNQWWGLDVSFPLIQIIFPFHDYWRTFLKSALQYHEKILEHLMKICVVCIFFSSHLSCTQLSHIESKWARNILVSGHLLCFMECFTKKPSFQVLLFHASASDGVSEIDFSFMNTIYAHT